MANFVRIPDEPVAEVVRYYNYVFYILGVLAARIQAFLVLFQCQFLFVLRPVFRASDSNACIPRPSSSPSQTQSSEGCLT